MINVSGKLAIQAVLIASLALGGCADAGQARMRVAGLATASVDGEGNIAARTRGCASFASDGRTCERLLAVNSVVRVASISKLVVAIGVMRLVESGVLDLDRDIADYLGFQVRNPTFPETRITLRQLLTHTSSLRDGADYAIPLGGSLRAEFDKGEHWDGAHAAGGYFTYSNFNFVAIGSIMEVATGERFDRLMERLVLKPLQIDGCFNWALCSPAALEHAATLYRSGSDETEWHPDGPWVPQADELRGRRPACPVRQKSIDEPCNLSLYKPGTNGALFSPQGGLRISITDLGKIAGLILGDGQWKGTRLLKASTVRQMLVPQWLYAPAVPNGDTENGSMCGYGISIQLTARVQSRVCRDDVFGDDQMRAGHLAEAYGLLGGLWVDLEKRRAVIYLVTGTSDDPRRYSGGHSAFSEVEETAAGCAEGLVSDCRNLSSP